MTLLTRQHAASGLRLTLDADARPADRYDVRLAYQTRDSATPTWFWQGVKSAAGVTGIIDFLNGHYPAPEWRERAHGEVP